MNLHKLLLERAAAGKPLRVGLIGAGKFGTMFLAQALRTPGLHLLGVADLAPERARESMLRVGWPAERLVAPSLGVAADRGTTWIGDDARALIAHPALDVAIDAVVRDVQLPADEPPGERRVRPVEHLVERGVPGQPVGLLRPEAQAVGRSLGVGVGSGVGVRGEFGRRFEDPVFMGQVADGVRHGCSLLSRCSAMPA